METVQLSRVHESLALVRGGEDDGVPESPIQRVGEIARGEEPAVLAKTRGGTIHHRELLRLTRPEVRRRGGETHGGERNGEGDHRRAPSRAPKSAAARGGGDRRDTRQFDQPIRRNGLRPNLFGLAFPKSARGLEQSTRRGAMAHASPTSVTPSALFGRSWASHLHVPSRSCRARWRAPRLVVRAEDVGAGNTFRERSAGGCVPEGAEPCNRPKRIILIRHAESEGNVDETMYTRKPDHRIELTDKGKAQAREAGKRLRDLLGPDETVYVHVSPYLRTMQTLYELGMAVGPDRVLGVREEPRIREQDFGNFQDATMRELKRERVGFGRFFYRFPNGESAADVCDRVTSFRETLRNDIDFGRFNCDARGCRTDDCTIVIVTHGLTLRVFLMRWYKWTTAMFSVLRNQTAPELAIMERGAGAGTPCSTPTRTRNT